VIYGKDHQDKNNMGGYLKLALKGFSEAATKNARKIV